MGMCNAGVGAKGVVVRPVVDVVAMVSEWLAAAGVKTASPLDHWVFGDGRALFQGPKAPCLGTAGVMATER